MDKVGAVDMTDGVTDARRRKNSQLLQLKLEEENTTLKTQLKVADLHIEILEREITELKRAKS